MKTATTLFIGLLLVTALSGCSKKIPQLGTVSGVVSLGGKQLEGIRVEYYPDPEKGNVAESSFAETDASGKYVLTFSGKENTPGAAVGAHRVVLWDFAAMNTRDSEAIPPRISDRFNVAAKTPIFVEVKSGEQTIDIDLDKYK